jgi:hypothetical protein
VVSYPRLVAGGIGRPGRGRIAFYSHSSTGGGEFLEIHVETFLKKTVLSARPRLEVTFGQQ